MSQTTIAFQFEVDDVLTDVDSIVLSNLDSTLGIIRNDTNASVVVAGTPLVRQSVGVYEYTFDDPDTGLEYTYWLTYVYHGATYTQQFNIPGSFSVPTCRYTTYDQFIRRWGTKLIATNSNKDSNSTTPDYGSVQQAFDSACDEIDDLLRGGLYSVPLNFVGFAGVIPKTVSEWANVLAFVFLYDARGLDDKSKQGNKLTMQRDRITGQIGFVRSGLRQINAGIGGNQTPATVDTQDVVGSAFWWRATNEVL